jgi:nucleotide-binding universal stress UspA family protein
MSGITVGIDGSPNSHRALDWAVQQAAARHCGLTVLTVHPVIASWVTGNPVTVPADKGLQEKERLAVEEATEKALKDAEPAKPASVRVPRSAASPPRSSSPPPGTATWWSSGRAAAAASTG